MRVPLTTSRATEINDRRRQVAALYLNKVDQKDIAVKLGVSQGTISTDLKALNKEWAEKAHADISEIKARELAELELMELEAAAQYQAAKKEKKDMTMLKFANHRLDIKKMRADLIGLNKPQKVISANVEINEKTDKLTLKEKMKEYEGIWDDK